MVGGRRRSAGSGATGAGSGTEPGARRRSVGETGIPPYLTNAPPFVLALIVAFFAATIVGWLKGGHPERFAAAALILGQLVIDTTYDDWLIGDVYVDSAIEDVVKTLFFGWLVFRVDRWWPFVVTGATVLTVLVHILTIVTDISWAAAVSARVGLELLAYLALLGGVVERWMAGEAPVSRVGRDGPGCRSGRAVNPQPGRTPSRRLS